VSGGTFSSTAIEIIKWVKFFALAQGKVAHILRPGKASEKTPKGVIPTSLCEILLNASRKKKVVSGSNPCWVRSVVSMGKCLYPDALRPGTQNALIQLVD
jgi:hypothetical protein